MARLFITPREVDFISDLNKEITKDVIGQKIFYYKIRTDLTDIHEVYEEALTKVFDPPIEIEARVDWDPSEVRTTKFGTETFKTIQVFIQYRDLLDRGLEAKEGDYISYGNIFFEITSSLFTSLIFGQVEYKTGLKLACKQARKGQIDFKVLGPTDLGDETPDAVQKTFIQQRGKSVNSEGETADKRALIEQGKVEPLGEKQVEISEKGDEAKISSSFYGDDYDD